MHPQLCQAQALQGPQPVTKTMIHFGPGRGYLVTVSLPIQPGSVESFQAEVEINFNVQTSLVTLEDTQGMRKNK